jgi:glycosyltransferase involved in cell wall biosynthesis
MTRVLHLITGLGSGGAEAMLVRIVLAECRRENGAATQIVVSLMDEGIYGAALREAGVDLYCLGCRRGSLSPRPLRTLVEIIRRHKPDILMSWLYHADLVGFLAVTLAGIGPSRLVWNLRCSNMDLSRYSKTTRYVVETLARLSRLPAAIAYNSISGRDYHARLGYKPKAWVYLPNGFDLDELRPDAADRESIRCSLAIGDDTILIGMVARVDPMKDHATFMAAADWLAARNAKVRFVIIGENTDRLPIPDTLQGRVEALGERRDVGRLMRGLDIMVLSSAFGEGFPNAVGEAMASEVPCIVTNVGDAATVVGDTGLIVPPASPSMLARAMLELVEETALQRRERGRRSRERIRQLYSLDVALEKYRALWRSVALGGVDRMGNSAAAAE